MIRGFKVLMLGASFVGKSAIMHRLVTGKCDLNTVCTVGFDCGLRKAPIADGGCLTFQIWDTPGDERYDPVLKPKILGTSFNTGLDINLFVCVYDICNKESLAAIRPRFLPMFRDTGKPSILVGNKIDDRSRRLVLRSTGEEFAREHGMGFCESSVTTGEGMEDLWEMICKFTILQHDNVVNQSIGLSQVAKTTGLPGDCVGHVCTFFEHPGLSPRELFHLGKKIYAECPDSLSSDGSSATPE